MNKGRWILVALALVLLASITSSGYAGAPSPQENLSLYAGNKLIISSTQQTIKSVFVRGNLTAAKVSNVNYPAKDFTLTTNSTQLYTLNIWLSYPSNYTTAIIINDPVAASNSQYTSYYVSAGDLNLTIFAAFQPAPSNGEGVPLSWSAFFGWFSQFGNAFPLWIKILYTILGAQFAFVGYRWIRFEDEKRRIEGHLPPLDRGNRIYLWIDVVFRTLLAGFIISLVLMLGETVIITVAQYLFFVTLNLFPLVDLFSLFFVAVLGLIIYLAREGLDKFLDLKPMMED
ncbi:hypothetical protein AUI06_10385 [archaeon 13_2_20CM_2_52_21]|nr:MAG: hypothetical protein AUI06_10385 [archaeon 13_2_20CM_2_52_21]